MYAHNPDLVSGVLGAVRGANADDSHPPALGRPRRLEQPRRGVGQLMHSPRHRYREDLHLVRVLGFGKRNICQRTRLLLVNSGAHGWCVAEYDQAIHARERERTIRNDQPRWNH